MPHPRVVIFTAVRMEYRAVARRLRARPTSDTAAILASAAGDVELHTIGIGGRHLPAALPPGTTRVILGGLGGGLDPALRVGDVVLDDADCGDHIAMPTPLATFAGEGGGGGSGGGGGGAPGCATVRRGRIVTADAPLTTPAVKADWFARTGAAAVDMEGSAVRRLAAAARVPLVHVRAISDAAGDAVDPSVLRLVDAVGRPRPTAVAVYVLRHPFRIASLARLGAAATLAVGRLADVVAQILSSPGRGEWAGGASGTASGSEIAGESAVTGGSSTSPAGAAEP